MKLKLPVDAHSAQKMLRKNAFAKRKKKDVGADPGEEEPQKKNAKRMKPALEWTPPEPLKHWPLGLIDEEDPSMRACGQNIKFCDWLQQLGYRLRFADEVKMRGTGSEVAEALAPLGFKKREPGETLEKMTKRLDQVMSQWVRKNKLMNDEVFGRKRDFEETHGGDWLYDDESVQQLTGREQ